MKDLFTKTKCICHVFNQICATFLTTIKNGIHLTNPTVSKRQIWLFKNIIFVEWKIKSL